MTSQSEHAPDGMYPRFEKELRGSGVSRRDFLRLAIAGGVATTAGLFANGKQLSTAEAIKVRNAKAKAFIDFINFHPNIQKQNGVDQYLLALLQEQGEHKDPSTVILDEQALRGLLYHSSPDVAVLRCR